MCPQILPGRRQVEWKKAGVIRACSRVKKRKGNPARRAVSVAYVPRGNSVDQAVHRRLRVDIYDREATPGICAGIQGCHSVGRRYHYFPALQVSPRFGMRSGGIRRVPINAAVRIINCDVIPVAVGAKHLARRKDLDFVTAAQTERLRDHSVRRTIIENPGSRALVARIANEPDFCSVVGQVFLIGYNHPAVIRKRMESSADDCGAGNRALQELVTIHVVKNIGISRVPGFNPRV